MSQSQYPHQANTHIMAPSKAQISETTLGKLKEQLSYCIKISGFGWEAYKRCNVADLRFTKCLGMHPLGLIVDMGQWGAVDRDPVGYVVKPVVRHDDGGVDSRHLHSAAGVPAGRNTREGMDAHR